MRIILNTAEFGETITRTRVLLDKLEVHHANLLILRRTERDGYPSQSMGGAGNPTNEIDDDGTPIPQHSDPVGRMVVERDEARDPAGNALAQLVQLVHTAWRTLEAAEGAGRKVELPRKLEDQDDLWCENCLKRAGVKTTREEGRKVCRWCRDEKAEHGHYPSRRLIEAHGRGRVTAWHRAQIAAQDAADLAKIRAERKRRRKQEASA